MRPDGTKAEKLAGYADSVFEQIKGELTARGVSLPTTDVRRTKNPGKAIGAWVNAAVRAGVITQKAGKEARWLCAEALREGKVVVKRDTQSLQFPDETMTRAAEAEQIVRSDIAASRNTPTTSEK